MVLNEFLSWRRRSRRLILTGDAAASAADATVDPAAQYAEQMAMLAEISKLPRRQRAVVALRYYEDRSDTEIAELLGCAPSSVRAYLTRAHAALRIELQRPGSPEPAPRRRGNANA